jgi:hypothetical protein
MRRCSIRRSHRFVHDWVNWALAAGQVAIAGGDDQRHRAQRQPEPVDARQLLAVGHR